MIFKTLNPEDVLKQLEGHENIINTAVEARNKSINQFSCPMCGYDDSPIVKVGDKPFRTGGILPECIIECPACGANVDADSGITTSIGISKS